MAEQQGPLPKESEDHTEALVDEAVLESFPASDPISPAVDTENKPLREHSGSSGVEQPHVSKDDVRGQPEQGTGSRSNPSSGSQSQSSTSGSQSQSYESGSQSQSQGAGSQSYGGPGSQSSGSKPSR